MARLSHHATSSPKLMVVTVMGSAQRYRELIADLESHRAGLGEPQMVGVGGASPADQTGLRCHEFEVGLYRGCRRGSLIVSYAFVDLGGSGVV